MPSSNEDAVVLAGLQPSNKGTLLSISAKSSAAAASEVAAYALELIEATRHWQINRRLSDTIQIKIGIQTGTINATLFSESCPNYYLFGDAITQAHRLESSGLPMRYNFALNSLVLHLICFAEYNLEKRRIGFWSL